MLYTGVDLLTLARVTQDDLAGYAAAAPVVIPVNSIDLPEEGSGKAIVKDGQVIGFHNTGKEQTITINCAAIAPDVLAGLLDEENSVYIDTGLNRINHFALGFRLLQNDGSYTYYCYQKGIVTVNSKSVETRQVTAATVESITFTPAVTVHKFAINGKPSRKITANTKKHTVDVAGWLAIVWTPDNFLPVPPPKIEIAVQGESAEITLLTARAGDTVRYTTDGTTPTLESAQYTAPITVSKTAVVKAIECAKCRHISAVAVADIESLILSPPEIGFSGYDVGTVSIKTDVQNVIIRYTTDGREVDDFSPIYKEPFTITRNGTIIKARAEKGGYITSEVAELTVTNLKVKTPVIGVYTGLVESPLIVYDYNY